jgi:hypothetical protein
VHGYACARLDKPESLTRLTTRPHPPNPHSSQATVQRLLERTCAPRVLELVYAALDVPKGTPFTAPAAIAALQLAARQMPATAALDAQLPQEGSGRSSHAGTASRSDSGSGSHAGSYNSSNSTLGVLAQALSSSGATPGDPVLAALAEMLERGDLRLGGGLAAAAAAAASDGSRRTSTPAEPAAEAARQGGGGDGRGSDGGGRSDGGRGPAQSRPVPGGAASGGRASSNGGPSHAGSDTRATAVLSDAPIAPALTGRRPCCGCCGSSTRSHGKHQVVCARASPCWQQHLDAQRRMRELHPSQVLSFAPPGSLSLASGQAGPARTASRVTMLGVAAAHGLDVVDLAVDDEGANQRMWGTNAIRELAVAGGGGSTLMAVLFRTISMKPGERAPAGSAALVFEHPPGQSPRYKHPPSPEPNIPPCSDRRAGQAGPAGR